MTLPVSGGATVGLAMTVSCGGPMGLAMTVSCGGPMGLALSGGPVMGLAVARPACAAVGLAGAVLADRNLALLMDAARCTALGFTGCLSAGALCTSAGSIRRCVSTVLLTPRLLRADFVPLTAGPLRRTRAGLAICRARLLRLPIVVARPQGAIPLVSRGGASHTLDGRLDAARWMCPGRWSCGCWYGWAVRLGPVRHQVHNMLLLGHPTRSGNRRCRWLVRRAIPTRLGTDGAYAACRTASAVSGPRTKCARGASIQLRPTK